MNLSQPLLRDFDRPARQQLLVSRTNRDIADTRLRESLVHTTRDVKSAYWNLVSARANVDARRRRWSSRRSSCASTRRRSTSARRRRSTWCRRRRSRREPGAADHRGDRGQAAEDRLRLLIFDPTVRDNWNVQLDRSIRRRSRPRRRRRRRVTRALAERADLLARARTSRTRRST
jgi:hypothetical protein